jgi:hypothetical protein
VQSFRSDRYAEPMTTTGNIDEQQVLAEFRGATDGWSRALESHRMAPPDQGFAVRLAGLAEAAREQARACRAADAAGFEWPPHRAADPRPPYELQPDTGRRGPKRLWRRFDAAVAHLNSVVAGRDILAVGDAYEELATLAAELSEAVEQEDAASSQRARGRTRRSA